MSTLLSFTPSQWAFISDRLDGVQDGLVACIASTFEWDPDEVGHKAADLSKLGAKALARGEAVVIDYASCSSTAWRALPSCAVSTMPWPLAR